MLNSTNRKKRCIAINSACILMPCISRACIFNIVVYLSCEYFNSKYFTDIFIIKNSIIHIHLPEFTSKIFNLFKNTMYNIRQANFGHFISLSKFAATNSVVKIRQKIQRCTSGNRRKSSTAPMHDLQLMSQQVPQAAVDEGHMWIKPFIYKN